MRMALIAIASLFGISFGWAEEIPNSEAMVGNWQIKAYVDENTHKFSRCLASVSMKNGSLLIISIDRGASTWGVGIANPTWKLPLNAVYPIKFSVDRGPLTSVNARAGTDEMIMFNLPPTASLFRSFQSGRVFHVLASGGVFNFDLTMSSRALDMAMQCTKYQESQEIADTSGNPFVPSSGAASVRQPTTDPSRKAEALATLTNVLSAAQIAGFKVAPSDYRSEQYFDAVWLAPGVVGGMTILADSSLESAAELAITNASRACKGDFASGRKPDTSGFITVTTGCHSAQMNTSSFFVVLPRSSGGSYLFTALNDGSSAGTEKAVEDAGNKASDAVMHLPSQ